jgi:hypothetical protein
MWIAFIWRRIVDQCRALANTIINFVVPLKAWNFFTGSMTISFSRRTLSYGIRKLIAYKYIPATIIMNYDTA